jgi:hypothetical protein
MIFSSDFWQLKTSEINSFLDLIYLSRKEIAYKKKAR